MKTLILGLCLGAAGCAHPAGTYHAVGPVECWEQPSGAHVVVQCRAPGRPETAKAMVVGEPGVALHADLRLTSVARAR